VVHKSINGRNKIDGCDFDETDPLKFIIKLFNSNERTLELRFIKIVKNECKCELSIVQPQDIELHSYMTSLITSLNNYLVLIDDKKVMFINEDKVLIQIEVEWNIKNGFSVSGTNDVIIYSWKTVNLLHFNEINNELEVNELICNDYISDIKIQNNYLIVNMKESISIYKLDDIRINNLSNPKVINKRLQEYCISSDNKYFIFTTDEHELFVYKLDDEINQIASLFLSEEMDRLVSSDKYISMVDKMVDKSIFTFEIIDETI
jgi:hypothetical protein